MRVRLENASPRRFNLHTILLGVVTVALHDLVEEIGLFARLDGCRILHGAEVVILRGQTAAEDDVAQDHAADPAAKQGSIAALPMKANHPTSS